jgi:hypothetical protein
VANLPLPTSRNRPDAADGSAPCTFDALQDIGPSAPANHLQPVRRRDAGAVATRHRRRGRLAGRAGEGSASLAAIDGVGAEAALGVSSRRRR